MHAGRPRYGRDVDRGRIRERVIAEPARRVARIVFAYIGSPGGIGYGLLFAAANGSRRRALGPLHADRLLDLDVEPLELA